MFESGSDSSSGGFKKGIDVRLRAAATAANIVWRNVKMGEVGARHMAQLDRSLWSGLLPAGQARNGCISVVGLWYKGDVCWVKVVAVVYFDVDVAMVRVDRNYYCWCIFASGSLNEDSSEAFARRGTRVGSWPGNVWGDGDEVV